MLKFLNLNPDIFGLDLNDLSLKVVKLKKKRKGFSLVSFNEANIEPGIVKEGAIQDQEALSKIIKSACNAVKGQKLGTKHIIVSLPEEKSFSRVIQMPKMTEEELKLAVPFEAENYIPLEISKVYLDFQVINTPYDKSHLDLLINVMPKAIVDSYVSCLKMAGFVPVALEVESQSITRALIKNSEDHPPVIIIDLGESSTSFVIFSGNSIRFTSSIPISAQQLTQAISDNLGLSFNKAEELKIKYGLSLEIVKKYNIRGTINPILNELVGQVKKYISFYQGHVSHQYFSSGDGKIQKIILCGGGASLIGLADFLSAQLKTPVELGNPFMNLIPNKKGKNKIIIPNQRVLSFTTALGIALRGANENF